MGAIFAHIPRKEETLTYRNYSTGVTNNLTSTGNVRPCSNDDLDGPQISKLQTQCETLSTAREIASVDLSGEREKYNEKMFHIHRKPQTSSSSTLIRKRLPQTYQIHESLTDEITRFLSLVFDWNPVWFQEPLKNSKTMCPVIKKEIIDYIKLRYSSHKEYCKINIPLLSLEMWAGIVRDYETSLEEKDKCIFAYCLFKTKRCVRYGERTLTQVTLQSLATREKFDDVAYPKCGDLVSLKYRRQNGSGNHETLGYIIRVSEKLIKETSTVDYKLKQEIGKPYVTLKFIFLTKEEALQPIELNRIHKLEKITYLRSSLRRLHAVVKLPESPLGNCILHPLINKLQLPIANNVTLATKENLNTRQLEAVSRITKAVSENNPKICLIRGPPGTGKSKVIVNIITQLLYGSDTKFIESGKKILVCAPSNTATDEIVLRLIKIQNKFPKSFEIIRMGAVESMHEEAKKVCLSEVTLKKLPPRDEPLSEEEQWRAENNTLRNTNVIASTLSSSGTNRMTSIFSKGDGISVCIVDEASQCAEAETLIPLLLRVRVLVLVGDTKQLPPTIISHRAKVLGLDQSLFERLEHIFHKNAIHLNPIIKLDTQYRMSDPVAHFPNKYFYNGALKNAATVKKLPIQFYKLIDMDSTQDEEKFTNAAEAEFVAKVVRMLLKELNSENAKLPVSVGIITPYKDQKAFIKKKLDHKILRLPEEITKKIVFDVNTVDAFQGQERDIIIMSCVRSKNGIGFLSDRHRLCVALTRAKHSTIVYGNFKHLSTYSSLWRALLNDARNRGMYQKIETNVKLIDVKRHVMLEIAQ